MGDNSNIEWTDATWNPIVGCSIVSPGCTNCYAMRQAQRIELMSDGSHSKGSGQRVEGSSHYAGTTKEVNGNVVWTGNLALAPKRTLTAPLRWKKPRTIFVNSMGDLFHEDCPDDWILDALTVMAIARRHTFQVLTKRAERMRDFMSNPDLLQEIMVNWWSFDGGIRGVDAWPLPNVWLGISAEDQRRYDERRKALANTPAAVRFLSAEPLLGPIDLHFDWEEDRFIPDWVIAGGESGPKARPMHPDWARSLRDQCAAASVPFFFKQWGEWKEAFHDEDGPKVNEVDNESDEAEALLAALDGKPGWLHADGRFFLKRNALPEEEPVRLMERLGKHRAGRLLDGREHNGMPEVRR